MSDNIKFKFKVGQVVKYLPTGETAEVEEVGHRLNGKKWHNYEVFLQEQEDYRIVPASDLQAITTVNKGTKTMSFVGELAQKVKALARSKEDKLLIEFGAMDENGDSTKEGRRLLIEYLFAENKAAIVEQLQALKDADKEDKKSKK